MTSIRIIATPAGEAPEHIRQAWIGLVLPLPENMPYPIRHAAFGVLTGPRNIFSYLLRFVFAKKRLSYFVNAKTAIELLAQQKPDAAQWWRENAPRYLTSTVAMLGFEPEVCELVP